MNTTHLALWIGLLTAALGPTQGSQENKEKQKKIDRPISRFFGHQVEDLEKEVEGCWTLLDYTDPDIRPVDNAASGFATFHDGFLTLVLVMDTFEQRLFRLREFMAMDTGLYRYRFDEQANLQLASLMSFTNQNDTGDMVSEPSGKVIEYLATIDDGVLVLRDPDGLTLSFRKIASGDFPESAIRKLDRRRGGVDQWETDHENRR
jgi:hypothetical protein